MSVLSVIGSSFIIVSYLYYTHLRKFAFKLVFILSVNDFFNQIGDFLLPSPGNLKEQELTSACGGVRCGVCVCGGGIDGGDMPAWAVQRMCTSHVVVWRFESGVFRWFADKPSDLCLAQAYMESFFELSSVLWTTAIAATLYMTVFLRIKNPGATTAMRSLWFPVAQPHPSPEYTLPAEAKMPIFVAVCYGVPLVMTIIPGAIGAYGPAGAWCWISRDYDYLRFVQFFIPLWIAILFNAIVYFRVIRMISNTFKATGGDDSTAQQMRQIINKLRFYPLILIIVRCSAPPHRCPPKLPTPLYPHHNLPRWLASVVVVRAGVAVCHHQPHSGSRQRQQGSVLVVHCAKTVFVDARFPERVCVRILRRREGSITVRCVCGRQGARPPHQVCSRRVLLAGGRSPSALHACRPTPKPWQTSSLGAHLLLAVGSMVGAAGHCCPHVGPVH